MDKLYQLESTQVEKYNQIKTNSYQRRKNQSFHYSIFFYFFIYFTLSFNAQNYVQKGKNIINSM